jgi:hypothetical protein
LFFGELWRGRDNLRVTFRGPRSLSHFQSALIPVAELWCLNFAFAALLFGVPSLAALFLVVALVPCGIRAARITRRQLRPGVTATLQAVAVAVVFDLARALALFSRGSHRARRAA